VVDVGDAEGDLAAGPVLDAGGVDVADDEAGDEDLYDQHVPREELAEYLGSDDEEIVAATFVGEPASGVAPGVAQASQVWLCDHNHFIGGQQCLTHPF
jgi:hypothetical protein